MQESLKGLEEDMDEVFADTHKRFDRIDKKLDRLQWLIVSTAVLVVFKDQLLNLFA